MLTEANMNTMEWECKLFNELSNHELFNLFKLRIDVFVVEQNCAYPELDTNDCHGYTRHLMGFENNELICCARLLAPGVNYHEASLGRFAVSQHYRHKGIGTELMHQCLHQLLSIWPKSAIRISAQQYLASFYTNFGFQQTSEVYLEDGIPHIEMLFPNKQN